MEPNVFFESVAKFVEWSGGDHAIEKILVANNGIGATKVSGLQCLEIFKHPLIYFPLRMTFKRLFVLYVAGASIPSEMSARLSSS